jgi:NTE family protein
MSVGRSKKIGYALGGGAARGLAHIGVLKVLEEHGIFPDIIVGTSMGALIGALYAGGIKVTDIEQFTLRLNSARLALLADVTLPLSGLVGGRRVVSLLKSILGDLTFSQMKYDFACVATDIRTGEQVVLHEGTLLEAVRASISLPGIFTPVKIGGRYLVDGGLINEVPVSVCREMGAEYVVGINVIPEPSKMMRHSRKGPVTSTLESTGPCETGSEKGSDVPSDTPSRSIRSRISDIDSAIQTFLLYRQPQRIKRQVLKPLEWARIDVPKRLRREMPSLVDVLSQTLTIAEYRVAVENMKYADLAISPDVEDIGFWQFTKAAQAIAVGEEAARGALSNANKYN